MPRSEAWNDIGPLFDRVFAKTIGTRPKFNAGDAGFPVGLPCSK